jgi:hypothetical protein
MTEYVIQGLFNGLLVTVGLYALWSLMKAMSPSQRGWSALVAGLVSAAASIGITAFIIATTSG